MVKLRDEYKVTRLMIIAQATLEYFISIIIGGAYLAKVTAAIGIPDNITGILTSFVTFGYAFQFLAIFLGKFKPVKKWVTILHIINQTFFAFIFFVPFLGISKELKILALIVFLLSGQIINNLVYAPRVNWQMKAVDDKKRGTFTASKEITSLLTGVVFSLAVSCIIDYFEKAGNINTAFLLCGIGVFVLMAFHTVSLIFTKEKPDEVEVEDKPLKQSLKELIVDKKLWLIVSVPAIHAVATSATSPFMGSYMTKELGFPMVLVTVASFVYAIARSLFSKFFGKFADKYSFITMLKVCYPIEMLGYALIMFTVPENGKVMYLIAYGIQAIAMAGINSSAINLIYDHVSKDKITGALGLRGTIVGFAGFLSTLAVSPLVAYIQNNNNSIFGISVYAQQVCALITVVLLGVLLVYINVAFKNKKKN